MNVCLQVLIPMHASAKERAHIFLITLHSFFLRNVLLQNPGLADVASPTGWLDKPLDKSLFQC